MAEARGHFVDTKEKERPPLEAAVRRLLKRKETETTQRVFL